jgi:hypothetical protein
VDSESRVFNLHHEMPEQNASNARTQSPVLKRAISLSPLAPISEHRADLLVS